MQTPAPRKKRTLLWIVGSGVGLIICFCVGFIVLGNIAGNDPRVQATGTARVLAGQTSTAQVLAQATLDALPTSTPLPTATPRPTETALPSATPSPTATLDPLFTPPTPTASPSPTSTSTASPSPTASASPTVTHTPLATSTLLPDTAGVTDWAVYNGLYLGVQEISFDTFLGYYTPEDGKIFVSLYVVALNLSDTEAYFSDFDFSLVDGGGEISGGAVLARKEPSFMACTILPGGKCEGWWTTIIWDRPEVMQSLTLRWDPCLIFCEVDFYALPISQ